MPCTPSFGSEKESWESRGGIMFTKLIRYSTIALMVAVTFTGISYAQNRPYQVNDRKVQNLLSQIENSTDRFRTFVDRDMDNSAQNGTRYEEGVMDYINAFENATDKLSNNFKDRRSTQADLEEVFGRASVINGFVSRNNLSNQTVTQWNQVRTQLNKLGQYYRTSWDWRNPRYPSVPAYTLTGTYRLNSARSDDVQLVVERILGGLRINNNNRETYRQSLLNRLTAPEIYAIEQRDPQFTIGSSLWPQVTFNADGRTFTEKGYNGRDFKVTATHSVGSGLTLNYVGDRDNDYYVNFARQTDGMLRVVRRIYLPERNETITVSSVYDRSSETAQWTYNTQDYPAWQTGSYAYVIPNGTQLKAVLNTPISTRSSQNGDRFELQVISPSQYRNAVISGRISNMERSGFVSGQANMNFIFENVRMQNGQSFAFSGIVDQLRLPNGNQIDVDNEGAIKERDQMRSTITRAGIGAAIGAVIGAVSAGPKGAGIGALIGAGAGVGSILIQGKDDVELVQGTEFIITSSAPNNIIRYR